MLCVKKNCTQCPVHIIVQLKTGGPLFDKFLVALVVKTKVWLAPTSQKLKCHHHSPWAKFQNFLANMVAGSL